MKNISRLPLVLLPPALLLLPRSETFLGATMTKKALVEPLVLLLYGWAVSRLYRLRGKPLYPPAAIAAATLLLLFWMIPRSIDLTQIHRGIDALYVISLVAAGCLLAQYLPSLLSVTRVVYALYLASMVVGLGLIYASQSTLLCSAYTLEIQHAFGWTLVPVGLGVYLLVLTYMTGWLRPRWSP